MNRRRWTWLALAVGLAVLAAVSAPVSAQEGAPASHRGTAANEAVEKILREQEQLLAGPAVHVRPGRAAGSVPVPLREGSPEEGAAARGSRRHAGVRNRPGRHRDPDPSDGDVALVMGSDNKGYFLRVGDEVYDGTLIAIDSGMRNGDVPPASR